MPPPLAVTRVGPDDVVHIGATPIAQFPAADVTTRRHVMVQLAEAGRLPGVQIAEQFGVTPVYVSLLRGRYRAHGSAALTARRRGPNGPMKVTPRLVARVRALRAADRVFDCFAILRPTSPFRTADTMRRAWSVFRGADGVDDVGLRHGVSFQCRGFETALARLLNRRQRFRRAGW